MLATLQDAWKRLVEYFKNMDKERRRRLIILVSATAILVAGVSIFLSRTTYSVLYTDMRAEDAGRVATRLDEMQVKYRAQGTDTILVDSSIADTVRVQLAAEGLPGSGFNFDIFSQGNALGSTDQEKNAYYQWQTGELIRTAINALNKVQDSYVIVQFSEESPFVLQRDSKPATAAVTLILQDGTELEDWEARAIYNTVKFSVPGLDTANISIVDSMMRSYTVDEAAEGTNYEDNLLLQERVQKTLEEQVVNLLTPALGAGRFNVSVHVQLDFDSRSSQSVEFDPPVSGSEDGLAVSLRNFAEYVRGEEEGGVAGFDPNGAASQYQEYNIDENSVYSQVSEEVNYELNEVRTQIDHAKGTISDLSVSILLDSTSEDGGEDPEDYRDIVRSIVMNAIGVNESRISVERMPFREGTSSTSAAEMLTIQEEMRAAARSAELIRLIIIVATILLTLLILFFIIRTLRKPKEAELEEGGLDLLADEELLPSTDEALAFIERENTNLAALEDYIEKSPESVASLLRNWLSDEGR